MKELIKIVGIGLTGGMLSLTLKRQRPEFAVLTALAASAVILAEIMGGVKDIITELERLVNNMGVDIKYLAVCIKAAGVAYISGFAAELLRDCGEGAVAAKVEVAGKIAVLVMAIPILEGLMDMCIKAVNAI